MKLDRKKVLVVLNQKLEELKKEDEKYQDIRARDEEKYGLELELWREEVVLKLDSIIEEFKAGRISYINLTPPVQYPNMARRYDLKLEVDQLQQLVSLLELSNEDNIVLNGRGDLSYRISRYL